MIGYDPQLCALCGETERTVVVFRPGRSLTSDSRIVDLDLNKIECSRCGLVRSGLAFEPEQLAAHYAHDYTLAAAAERAEPVFAVGDRLIERSRVVSDWIEDAVGQARADEPRTILEIGCGEGSLLARLAERWPKAEVRGFDLSPAAVETAARRGLTALVGEARDATGTHDLIVSFAVLEHVPSPGRFLAALRERLSEGGILVIAQPAQDVPSSDLFFVDHLWHFGAEHVRSFAASAGLKTVVQLSGHRLMPSFSLHVLTADEAGRPPLVEYVATRAREAADEWVRVFGSIDAFLDGPARDAPLAVWGLGQTFDLFRTYSALGVKRISAGIDDNPRRYEGAPYPVGPLEEASIPAGAAILLTFAPPAPVRERLRLRHLRYFAPLARDEAADNAEAILSR